MQTFESCYYVYTKDSSGIPGNEYKWSQRSLKATLLFNLFTYVIKLNRKKMLTRYYKAHSFYFIREELCINLKNDL